MRSATGFSFALWSREVASLLVGLFLIGLGVAFWRQSSGSWWPPGETPPKSIAMEASWGRYVAPIAVVCGVIVVIIGVASLVSESDDREGAQPSVLTGPAASSSAAAAPPSTRSLDVCADRLAADAALRDVAESPGGDGAVEGLAVLRDVQAPVEIRSAWSDVLALVEAAVEEGVVADAVSDGALVEAGVAAAAGVDLWAVTTACDPTGSPADFGCPTLAECGEEIAGEPTEANASASVIAALTPARPWTVEYCSSEGVLDRCELSAAQGRKRADVEFSRTTDGTYFAWFARVDG